MTEVPDKLEEWQQKIVSLLKQLDEQGLTQEVAFFQAIMQLLDGQEPVELAAESPYAQALESIQESTAAGVVPEATEVISELQQAILAYLKSPNWQEARRVVEAQSASLLQPEADQLLNDVIAQAHDSGQVHLVKHLELRRDILRACREVGIEAAFSRLDASGAQSLPFPEELVPRTVAALRGTPEHKMAHAQYLSTLPVDGDDQELQDFIRAIQTALFGGDVHKLGQSLTGICAAAWQAIVDALDGDVPPP